jgi:hypothetical protein
MVFKKFDKVKIIKIRNLNMKLRSRLEVATPKADDTAVTIDAYESPILGYELECSDIDGISQWQLAFTPCEMELV